mmetsp:Transcript_108324/g.336670  ORF Transcript_108324/g.336670 Transcript_108324/m.336670 type:complete len:126 (+) Transcript_108324:255-632(+)
MRSPQCRLACESKMSWLHERWLFHRRNMPCTAHRRPPKDHSSTPLDGKQGGGIRLVQDALNACLASSRNRAKLCIHNDATGTTGVPPGCRVSKSQGNQLHMNWILRRRAQLPEDAADVAACANTD